MTEITLNVLVGLHYLTGVCFGERKVDCDDYAVTMSFMLDGIVYTAVESPDDGYRSIMGELLVGQEVMTNVFPTERVFCRIRDDSILDCYNVLTGKLIFAVGTDHGDGYYPWFVNEFLPENLTSNEGKSAENVT